MPILDDSPFFAQLEQAFAALTLCSRCQTEFEKGDPFFRGVINGRLGCAAVILCQTCHDALLGDTCVAEAFARDTRRRIELFLAPAEGSA